MEKVKLKKKTLFLQVRKLFAPFFLNVSISILSYLFLLLAKIDSPHHPQLVWSLLADAVTASLSRYSLECLIVDTVRDGSQSKREKKKSNQT